MVDVNRQAELNQEIVELRTAANEAERQNRWHAANQMRSLAADLERELGRVSTS